MTPNVERFVVKIDVDTIEAFQECLQTWSSTLTHLSFDTYDQSSIAFVCSTLRVLRSLEARATNVPPNALRNLVRLEILGCYYCTVQDLEELVNLLEEKEKPALPLLRSLYLMSDGISWDETTDIDRSIPLLMAIQRICDSRNITFVEHFD